MILNMTVDLLSIHTKNRTMTTHGSVNSVTKLTGSTPELANCDGNV